MVLPRRPVCVVLLWLLVCEALLLVLLVCAELLRRLVCVVLLWLLVCVVLWWGKSSKKSSSSNMKLCTYTAKRPVMVPWQKSRSTSRWLCCSLRDHLMRWIHRNLWPQDPAAGPPESVTQKRHTPKRWEAQRRSGRGRTGRARRRSSSALGVLDGHTHVVVVVVEVQVWSGMSQGRGKKRTPKGHPVTGS